MASKLGLFVQRFAYNNDGNINLPFRKPFKSKDGNDDNKRERMEQKRLRKGYKAQEQQDIQEKRRSVLRDMMAKDSDEERARYDSQDLYELAPEGTTFMDLSTLPDRKVGDIVSFRARIHSRRKLSSKLAFIVLRQQLSTIQAVVETGPLVTPAMVQFAEHVNIESIVIVRGELQKPKEPVHSCTIHDLELKVMEVHVVSEAHSGLPFKPADYEAKMDRDEHSMSDRTVIGNPILHLRSPAALSIMRVNAGVCNIFRTFLDDKGFLEIHSPKLQGGATESGSSVFEVKYFARRAFLAQSPQFSKEACISSDFGRVYEIGPVFRAENSNTHRHLTEYTGLDLEMEIKEDYHEAMHLIDEMLKSIFKGVYERFGREIESIQSRYPSEKLVWLEETPIIDFADGIKMLVDSGWEVDGVKPSPEEDLDTRSEIRLGELVKEKYGTDYYILDHFPISARPFYTMRTPDGKRTNSFDIFVRGQEIITGGQRVHEASVMRKQISDVGQRPEDMAEYLDGLDFGTYPHAGCGIGLERLLMLLLKLPDIRYASINPRDPKSFPNRARGFRLRYPESSTTAYRVKGQLPQDLEKLIASYGDASSTSFTDSRMTVWRDEGTGAAVGYGISDGFAIMLGDPLCDVSQMQTIIHNFLDYLKQKKLHPLWLLISENVESILATRFGWRTISCVAEQRVQPGVSSKPVSRKIQQSEREGVTITVVPRKELPPPEIKEKIDKRIEDWLANRKGKQVRLTEIRPWVSSEYRRYLYSQDKDGQICTFVVLAELSLEHGYQLKWALDFPDAPSGAIEAAVMRALEVASETGATSVTFGTSALSELIAGHNINKVTVKSLATMYKAISQRLHLLNKTEFREKLGAEKDEVYIAWPNWGFGPRAVKAILDFLEG